MTNLPTDRRRFLRIAASGGCCLPGLLSACAAAPTFHAVASDGRVRIPTIELDSAFGDDDVLMVRSGSLAEAVYLLRSAEGQVSGAVGATCTHLGCEVRPARRFFRCPCHGSTYSLDGEVVRGPAPKPLTRYEVSVTEDFVEIELP